MHCPACGHDNIDGADSCQACLADLRHEDTPRAATEVERRIMELPVSRLQARAPARLPARATLRKAIETMRDGGHGCVLVVDDEDNLIGIFTERDVLDDIAGQKVPVDLDRATLARHMTSTPETVRPDESLRVALNRMAVGGFRHLPLDGGEGACGLITARDVLAFVEENFREAVTGSFKRFVPGG